MENNILISLLRACNEPAHFCYVMPYPIRAAKRCRSLSSVHAVRGNVVSRIGIVVCPSAGVSVCNALTYESLDLESLLRTPCGVYITIQWDGSAWRT